MTSTVHGLSALSVGLGVGLPGVGLLAPTVPLAAVDTGWTAGQTWLRLGLPLLLVVVGAAVWWWGRQEQLRARAQLGTKGGFGGPPGTTDIGAELGFGVDGPGPDRNAGRSKILAGLVCAAAGIVLFVAMVIWKLAS